MKHEFDAELYGRVRDEAKKYFLAKKTGDQDLFAKQSKLFDPIIQSTKELENKLISELAQEKTLPQLEYGSHYECEPGYLKFESTPKPKSPIFRVDMDGELLNDTHQENLQDMALELPSIVYQANNIEQTLEKIKSINRSLGQYLGGTSKKPEIEKEIYKSRKETLQIYEKKIKALAQTMEFDVKKGEGRKLIKLKRGRGRPKTYPDVIHYKSPNELVQKLDEYVAGKKAGNTGLDNYINSILDELVETKAINKSYYDKIYQNVFD